MPSENHLGITIYVGKDQANLNQSSLLGRSIDSAFESIINWHGVSFIVKLS